MERVPHPGFVSCWLRAKSSNTNCWMELQCVSVSRVACCNVIHAEHLYT